MCNTELGIFCTLNDNWKELLSAEPYNIKISEDGPYVMFKYNQLSSDFSLPVVQEARGIIFKTGNWTSPVCWGFNKFFNYGEETAADINWDTAFVSEKIDGSLIKLWFDCGWHISTNGTIESENAELSCVKFNSFYEYFTDTLGKYYDNSCEFYGSLNIDYTYMFELVGPYNRVVIPYETSALYFLGARNNKTGEEFNCSATSAGALGMGRFNLPKQYKLSSVEDCIKAAELKSWDEEGFVVCDSKFNRVKIKSPAYVMAHFARNNNVINRKHLINVILTNEVEEFLCYAADYKEELENVQKLMKAYTKVGDQIVNSCQRLYDIPKKTYAYWVQTLPKIYQGLAFINYNNIMSTKDYTAGWNENKWDTYLEEFEKLKESFS